jgi:AAA domain
VELRHEYGQITGVVTPYTVQADATLEALRDVEPGGRPLAEVGTAHRFQGREFPVVVFDTVEPQHDGGLWIGQASRQPGSTAWQQSGVRLFNVATTRVKHRLYVIVSRERVWTAKPGTAASEPRSDGHHARPPLGPQAAQSPPRRGVQQATPLTAVICSVPQTVPRAGRPVCRCIGCMVAGPIPYATVSELDE